MDTHTERPLLADIREELGSLGVELHEMASARWELARLELKNDLQSAKRLVVVWLAMMVLTLTSLPLMAVSLAEVLDGFHGVARGGWLLIFACGLLILATVGGYAAWRRFRRKFVGLRETLEELHEDLLWFQETGGTKRAKET